MPGHRRKGTITCDSCREDKPSMRGCKVPGTEHLFKSYEMILCSDCIETRKKKGG